MLQKRGMHNLFLANHYKTFFEDNKKKLNKVWADIKEIININNKTPTKLGTLTIMESQEQKKSKYQIHLTTFSVIFGNKLKMVLYLHKKHMMISSGII